MTGCPLLHILLCRHHHPFVQKKKKKKERSGCHPYAGATAAELRLVGIRTQGDYGCPSAATGDQPVRILGNNAVSSIVSLFWCAHRRQLVVPLADPVHEEDRIGSAPLCPRYPLIMRLHCKRRCRPSLATLQLHIWTTSSEHLVGPRSGGSQQPSLLSL